MIEQFRAVIHEHPGAVVQRYVPGFWSTLVRKAIGSFYTHDALVILDPDDYFKIGDCTPKGCHLTELETYVNGILHHGWSVRVLRPRHYSISDGRKVSEWWYENVHGRPYDFAVVAQSWYVKLLWKFLATWLKAKYNVSIPDHLAENFEFAYWCTEGCQASYIGGTGRDLWKKRNPTPRTTEKRTDEGVFQVIANFWEGK